MIVQTFYDHAIHLELDGDSLPFEIEDLIHRFDDRLEPVSPSRQGVLMWIEYVETQVDIGESSSDQSIEVSVQGDPVGRDTQLFQANGSESADALDKPDNVFPHRRFTSRQSNLRHPLLHK